MYIRALLMAFILTTSTTACSAQRKVDSGTYNLMLKTLLKHSVPEVSVSDVLAMDSPVLLDSRELEEYDVSHLQDAVWVGYDDFDMSRVADVPKSAKIVVYCSVGARSEKISKRLIEAGYTDVSNLYGGIFEWVNREQPIYNAEGRTDRVHAYNRTWGVWVKRGQKVYE